MQPTHLLSTIRQWLGVVQLGPHSRLPSERELAERFQVTRAALRKALTILEDEGLIRRHVGKGTFVISNDIRSGQDIAEKTSPLAAMQARSVVEPELARLAAINATSAQFAEMRELCSEMRGVSTWEGYAELDWRFHNLIAEATGNVLLVEIQQLLNGVRRHVVWGNLVKRSAGPPPGYHSFSEHEEILGAIQARDADRAMRGMLAHLGVTQSQLVDYRETRNLLPAN